MGFNMMNLVDLHEKGLIFQISGQLATASDHQQTQKFMHNSPWRVNSLGRRVVAEPEIFCRKTML